MKKRISLLLCLALLLQTVICTSAGAVSIGGNYLSSAGACVMDYETGEVYYEYNGYTPRVPASMTKIMNLYCVYEALKNGEISLDTPVPISAAVYNKSRDSVYQSVLPLYYNTVYTVDEMIDVAAVYSASGAAVALAELVGGGSESAFVERMNRKAAEMGLDAVYYDSCGIAENKISPISMAKLAANIIRDYPDILVRTSKPSVRFHGNTYPTTDHLLDTYYYSGADGLKTGTTPAAGYCFCGTAVRNGRRMISVTMSSSSTGQRFIDTARLLDYGFAAANDKYGSIYYTDMRTFVNGTELPTFLYNGGSPKVLIIAEDLHSCGFDVSYDPDTKTVYAKFNENKPHEPIALDSYKNKNGEKAFSIASGDVSLVIDDGAEQHKISDIYNIGGYICASVDEIGAIYNYAWNDAERAANITAFNKTAAPETAENPLEGLTSKSAFIMDYETGDELYSLDADTRKPAASIAKMMTVYVLLDAVKNGELSLDQTVPISENVYNLSRNEDYKMMANLNYDETYTLDEMLDMIVIDSAAACVTACAELLCGNEGAFAERMNQKAKEIGIGSEFHNGTGVCLNPDTDGLENLMSARDIAIMARRMIEDYPEVLERTKRASVDFHGQTYYNLNKLFTDYYYEGADGFKNGMTDASGYCMCATAERGGKRVITVSLPSDSNEARFTDSIMMMDYAFEKLGVSGSSDLGGAPGIDGSRDITINIDGNYIMNFSGGGPAVKGGEVTAPVRELFETLEKTVEWSEAENKAVIRDETTAVTLTLGSDTMTKTVKNPIDGSETTEQIQLSSPAEMLNDKLCAPITPIVEAFGAAVITDADTNTILIIAGVC